MKCTCNICEVEGEFVESTDAVCLGCYYKAKAIAELFDEAVDLRSELYAALGVLILATPTGNYRNDLTELNIRFMEHIRKAKEL